MAFLGSALHLRLLKRLFQQKSNWEFVRAKDNWVNEVRRDGGVTRQTDICSPQFPLLRKRKHDFYYLTNFQEWQTNHSCSINSSSWTTRFSAIIKTQNLPHQTLLLCQNNSKTVSAGLEVAECNMEVLEDLLNIYSAWTTLTQYSSTPSTVVRIWITEVL